MISESVIARVWAAEGVSFYGSTQLLNDALASGASNVVYEISTGVLGVFGGILAVAGGLLTWFAIVNDNGFQTIWRYFSWSNQTLAMIALWVSTAYLLKKGKYRFGSLLTAFPASFMTSVSITYILMAKEGFRLDQTVSYIVGLAVAVILVAMYLAFLMRGKKETSNK